MTNENFPTNQCRTLEEIELHKALVLKDIQKDSATMKRQWSSLFHKTEGFLKGARPSKRINSILNTGAGMLDAFLLGWKLYKKFKPRT